MKQRRAVVTEGQLELMAHKINVTAGTPVTTWEAGKACVGNYHISFAYGGVALHQIKSAGGAARDVFGQGHMPKRELYNMMLGFTPEEAVQTTTAPGADKE